MSKTRAKVRASDSGSGAAGLDRRHFLVGGAALIVAPWADLARAAHHEAEHAAGLPGKTRAALDGSPYVYVSPLRADGNESTCHGEVWYGWFDGAVHLTTSATSWKARARARGLERARIWVGDHGRWKRTVGRNEAFRAAPHFDARVRLVEDDAIVAKLLGIFAKKYPAGFPRWKDRMEKGHIDGSRVLLRYDPV